MRTLGTSDFVLPTLSRASEFSESVSILLEFLTFISFSICSRLRFSILCTLSSQAVLTSVILCFVFSSWVILRCLAPISEFHSSILLLHSSSLLRSASLSSFRSPRLPAHFNFREPFLSLPSWRRMFVPSNPRSRSLRKEVMVT